MKNKIIDILSENIEQLDKEEIAAALEIPKKQIWETSLFHVLNWQRYSVKPQI